MIASATAKRAIRRAMLRQWSPEHRQGAARLHLHLKALLYLRAGGVTFSISLEARDPSC